MSDRLSEPVEPPSFRCELASRLGLIQELTRSLGDWAGQRGMPASELQSVCLVLDELISNIVIHGHRQSPRGTIEVEATIAACALHVTVTDNAPPFNPLLSPEPDVLLPIDQRPVGGLGLLFIRRLTDSLDYCLLTDNKLPPRNRIRFSKRFNEPGSSPTLTPSV